MNKQSLRQAKYDAKTARRYGLKLHRERDSDIIAKLNSVESIQGYIKSLVRKDLNENMMEEIK